MSWLPFTPAAALRSSLRAGYGLADLRADLLAGCVVGVVALPLSMALAIAVGLPPQHGIYTAIVGGALIALFGGSRVQVSGPTAAFVVVLAPIVTDYGLAGLALATAMAGVFTMVFAFAGFGRLIELVPHPVTTGFTAGIGLVIIILQLRDLLGLEIADASSHALTRLAETWRALPSLHAADLGVGLLCMAVMIAWKRRGRWLPAPLVGLSVAVVVALILERMVPGLEVATIARRFHTEIDGVLVAGIPPTPPLPLAPWRLPGADAAPLVLDLDLLRHLLPSALAIAALGALESLLSAVVADGMIGSEHDPNAELFAQGLGNLAVPFFGGFAAIGAIARTATNVRSGARSPISAIVHAVFLLVATMLTAPLLGLLPMAALAALLILVAWNMSEPHLIVRTVRRAPRSDIVVMLTCLGLTVVFDMVVAVAVGLVLASFLFMRRMIEVSEVRQIPGGEHHGARWPAGVVAYEIAGPLFFGAAARAMRALGTVEEDTTAVVLDLSAVPVLDATGLAALESAIARLEPSGIPILIAGVDRQPLRVLLRAGWKRRRPGLELLRSTTAARRRIEAMTRVS